MPSQVPRLGGVVLGFVSFCTLEVQAAEPEPATLSADRSVALALANHPDLRAAEAALQTAKATRSASAVFLDNPQATAWASLPTNRLELSIAQPLSLTGEGWHARAGARWHVREAAAALARKRRVIAADTRRAYVTAVVALGRTDVALEGTELAGRLRYAVGRQFEEGEASALDLRLTKLAEIQAAGRLLQSRKEEVVALQALASRVAHNVAQTDLELDPLQASPPISGIEASAERADITAATAALQAAQTDLRRQRAAALPLVAVGLGVSVESGQTFLGPTVSWSPPLFGRNQVGVAAARGAVAVAEGRVAAVQARARTEQQTATARAQEADRMAESLVDPDSMGDARGALASIEAGVLAGEIDLATAVLLQAQAIQGEAAIVELRGLVAQARIDLLLAMGSDALIGGGP